VRTSIPAGKLLRRGQLQRLKSTVSADASGHVDETDDANWEFVQNRWFSIVPAGSKQFLIGDQQRADVTHQITMRYDSMSSSVTVGWRMSHRGEVYNFNGPPVDRNLDKVLLDFPAIVISS
jgi:SPP1 family predicted phage head-tail adaptor